MSEIVDFLKVQIRFPFYILSKVNFPISKKSKLQEGVITKFLPNQIILKATTLHYFYVSIKQFGFFVCL